MSNNTSALLWATLITLSAPAASAETNIAISSSIEVITANAPRTEGAYLGLHLDLDISPDWWVGATYASHFPGGSHQAIVHLGWDGLVHAKLGIKTKHLTWIPSLILGVGYGTIEGWTRDVDTMPHSFTGALIELGFAYRLKITRFFVQNTINFRTIVHGEDFIGDEIGFGGETRYGVTESALLYRLQIGVEF